MDASCFFLHSAYHNQSSNLSTTHRLSLSQETFRRIDTDGDGMITVKEFKEALKREEWAKAGIRAEEVNKIMEFVDIDHDGGLSWHEIELACINRKMLAAEERLWRAFTRVETPLIGRF